MQRDLGAERLFELLDERITDSQVIVDAGCGRGVHLDGTRGAMALRREREAGARIIGFDVAAPASPNPYVTEFHTIPIHAAWPIDTATADVVFSDWVLEHVANPDHFFSECSRVLRPGGHLLARTLQKWSVAGIGARLVPHRFHNKMIAALQPGMNLEDVFPTTLRCHTNAAIQAVCDSVGMDVHTETFGGLEGYGGSSPTLRAGLRTLEGVLPRSMKHTVVLDAIKRPHR